MRTLACALVAFVSSLFRSRLALQLENVALRHPMKWGVGPTQDIDCTGYGLKK